MHRRSRRGRDAFSDFGDPFAGFGGFPGERSLLSSFFGGRNPFDDPFFRNPFGSMFESSIFSSGIPFASMHHHESGFFEHHVPEPKRPRRLTIEEINSDDEKEEGTKESENPNNSDKKPLVEEPDDEAGEEKVNQHLQIMDHRSGPNHTHVLPRASSFTFQSSSVTYGSSNGTYYTSSRTRRTGSDGVIFEESKEADTATREATHRISRGLHNKGHSVTRKLNSNGMVDTMQTLHNLRGDELDSFESSWARKSRSLPGWPESSNDLDSRGGIGQNGQTNRGRLALPYAQHPRAAAGRMVVDDARNPSSSHMEKPSTSRKGARYMMA